MKNLTILLIILQLYSCVSTKNVAETRNSEYSVHNNFEFFKFWRELDILRFNNNILNVKIALIPENKTLYDFETDSQMVIIFDSLHVMIKEKMGGFKDLKKTYFDTTDHEKKNIYQKLKSDSTDNIFLNEITDNPYFDLYEEIFKRLRNSIQKSKFYSSQKNFEKYIQQRSIEVLNKNFYEDIFGADTLSVNKLSKNQISKLSQNQVDFLISFSGTYNIDYSDRARGHIGSETIRLILFDIHSAKIISKVNITQFWGSD